MEIRNVNPNELIPYKKNTKRHSDEQIDNVAASIKRFGFVQPVVVDKNKVIVIGHSRTLAAKKLGLTEIPVVMADTLTEEEIKALRIADNKLNESAWDLDNLEFELQDINWEEFDMDFDFTGNTKRHRSWSHLTKKCNLKKQIRITDHGDYVYTSFYGLSKDGMTLEEIKADRSNVELFCDNLVDYVNKAIGYLGESWCLITTPRRRNKEFHFATEICKLAADELGIPFYDDAIVAENRRRVEPDFWKNAAPAEDNIILYDDIITTGKTIEAARNLFIDDHAVFPIIAIRNK